MKIGIAYLKLKHLFFFALLFTSHEVMSQPENTSQAKNTESIYNDPPKAKDIAEQAAPKVSNNTLVENTLSLAILSFVLIALILEFLLIHNKRLENDQGLRIFAITLIIGSSLFLVTAGYTNDQIAPVLSLLGTLAGYLLGNFKNKPE